MASHTIRLHRVVRSSPEKVYRAFLDADAVDRADFIEQPSKRR